MVAYTHSHADHVASAERFRQSGARIAIHEAARNADRWGGMAIRADSYFRDGDLLEAAGLSLRVHHTPGHTPDSCCFLTRIADTDVLFAGDLTGWFFPGQGSDYGLMVASVQKARSLGADLVCGGHWVCDHELDTYWDKLSRSLGQGIFSLVDHFGAKDHYDATARRMFGQPDVGA
jgi:glyoxylase-like metal-dependent hydrolase (beta-lactamase superfamily II)